MSEPRILVTNDDGIESPGFRALYEALEEVGDPIAVAPYSDQSAIGRARSFEATVHEYDLGYALEGTPVDCVIAGIESLCPDVDLVVAGCNKGANLGAYVMGRSGTVSAAVEAAFFDIPAIAVSMYVPTTPNEEFADINPTMEDYADACEAAAYLAENAHGSGVFESADYLNVNAPAPNDTEGAGRPEMVITEPSKLYAMSASFDGETLQLKDDIWRMMQSGENPDETGTDRRAVIDGKVSVSPLTAPHNVELHPGLDDLAAAFSEPATPAEE